MFDMFNEENSSSYENSSSNQNEEGNRYSTNCVKERNSIDKDKLFVISVGGSVFFDSSPLNEKIKGFLRCISDLKERGFSFVLVVGGGKVARDYRDSAIELGVNNFELDSIGIATTRLNAQIIISSLEESYKKVLCDVRDVDKVLSLGKIPVFGGLSEGQTTDAVGALIAEFLDAKFINLSNVDGIYDDDPKENSNAQMFDELSFGDMNLLLKEKGIMPGQNLFVDKQAAAIITRSKIESYFLNGEHLENFKNCLNGYDYKGTLVHDTTDKIEFDEKDFIEEEPIEKTDEKPKKKIGFRSYDSDDDEDTPIDPSEIHFG